MTTKKNKQMNWNQFKNVLILNQDKHVQFQYEAGKFVDAAFHITEIKQANLTSVDCGGKLNAWTEVIVQLWVSGKEHAEKSMLASKALKIIDLVEDTLPLQPKAEVKIEFGDSNFDTRQLLPQEITVENDCIIVQLQADKTQCKATDRGDTCGTPKMKLPLATLSASACAPESGCCS